jgi:hypothetical protein
LRGANKLYRKKSPGTATSIGVDIRKKSFIGGFTEDEMASGIARIGNSAKEYLE